MITEKNLAQLCLAVATKNVGNMNFVHKYGLEVSNKADELLRPYAESDDYPPDEIIDKAHDIFVKEFSEALAKKLEEDIIDDNFFRELVSGING